MAFVMSTNEGMIVLQTTGIPVGIHVHNVTPATPIATIDMNKVLGGTETDCTTLLTLYQTDTNIHFITTCTLKVPVTITTRTESTTVYQRVTRLYTLQYAFGTKTLIQTSEYDLLFQPF
jgi:hypothetical protein